MTTRWNISELAAHVANALSEAALDQDSGRVSDVPSARTIRYYTTHGLLDRPVDFDGRTALYDERHLHQLVAIKRLQARGLKLSEVQQMLAGATPEKVATIAGIGEVEGSADAAGPTSERAFWKGTVEETTTEREERSRKPHAGLSGATLEEGISLLLQGAKRPLYADDLEAMRVAAQPLIKLLKTRRIIGEHDTRAEEE